MKRLVRWLLWGVSPVAAYLLLALAGSFVPWTHEPHGLEAKDHQIILAAGPIHYDFLLPLTPEVRAAFADLDNDGLPLSDAAWLSVGWGSEAFYTTAGTYADVTYASLWTAATWDDAVMRYEVYGPLPDHPKLRRIWIGQDQLNSLVANFRAAQGAAGLAIDGFSETDVFYPATGRFNLLRTCNVWVSDQLRAAGLTMGVWTPTPFAVTLSLWWNGHLAD